MTRAYPVIVAIALTAAAAPLRAQEPSAQATQSAQATAQATQAAQAAAQARQDLAASQAAANEKAAAAQLARDLARASIVPLKLTIVLSKYQNDKKVSSLPYELTVRTDNNKASIRMGTQVPVPGIGAPNPAAADPAAPAPRIGPFVMRDVFTNIDCTASNLDSGRFAVTVTIEDSSIYEDSQRTVTGGTSKVSGVSATRMFRTTNALVLRDGQSTEFTTAVDKVSGEVTKASVTLAVVK
jgi:hypothetical protein